MSFIISVALISVWISATSGITLGPSTGSNVPNSFNKNPNPNIVNTLNNVWRDGTTCEVIFNTDPSNPTGYYIKLEAGKLTVMYCDMNQIFNPSIKNIKKCGKDGPWERIGYLNMAESYNCPSAWQEYTTGGIRTCKRKSSGASCDSDIIHLNGKQYTEICGRVVGYQYGLTMGIIGGSEQDINRYYVNGVSITHGTPRQHVWTLMAGLSEKESVPFSNYLCPCQTGGSHSNVQKFIENDWYCESGNTIDVGHTSSSQLTYMSDPLWDGKGCSNDESPCCAQKPGQPPQPWFHKVIPGGTNDDLEIRICNRLDKSSADVLVTMYELYII